VTKSSKKSKVIKKKKKEVRIGSSNVKERTSRNGFEIVMSPWVCTGTAGADHGHDYHIEIVSTINIEEYKPDGRFFLVQLKSQTKLEFKDEFLIPHPVETRKIRQWYNSSAQIPFLFVVNDLKTNRFYYQWIDEEFISDLEKTSPFWTKNEKVAIRIPKQNLISESSKESLREYVYNYKYVPKKLLEPGVFFDLKDKITNSIDIYEQLINNTPFESVQNDVLKLKEKLENAVYRIAITGLSRVGKSSLINSLLKRPDISPTDIWQTTGVPILIHPGREEKVKINFYDSHKPSEILPYSSENIKEYAAREFNEDNHKGVSEVNVFISSSQLERGVMFYDIPGLDDPNDQIMDFAYHTADCANVILYIIDGASAKTGSFVFKNDYKKHIEKFSQSKDKIFLIVNKVDELSPERLQGLKNEIEKNLEKYKLKDKIASKIYFVSIDPDKNNDLKKLDGEISSIQELENDLWSFMLTENKVGFFKLYSLIRELQQSIRQLESIKHTRSLEAGQKRLLVKAINEVKTKIPNLEQYIKNQRSKIRSTISKNLDLRKGGILKSLEKSLLKMPDMPTDDAIKTFLIKKGHNAVIKTQDDLALELTSLQDYIDKWIEENLKQVRDIINLDKKKLDYSNNEIKDIVLPPFDFSSAWGKGIIAALAGFMWNPVVAAFGFGLGIGSAILDLILGKEERKAKRIHRLMGKIDAPYSITFNNAKLKFDEATSEQMNVLVNYINRKLKLYFSDIEGQIGELNLHPTFDYEAFEVRSKNDLKEVNGSFIGIWEELQLYMSVIKPV
jgi:GTPase Era involved in 16S rRNA processing